MCDLCMELLLCHCGFSRTLFCLLSHDGLPVGSATTHGRAPDPQGSTAY